MWFPSTRALLSRQFLAIQGAAGKSLGRNHQRARRRLNVSGTQCSKLEFLEPRVVLASDFGDAPAPYLTTIAENGAQHVDIGPMLGASRDAEADGAHSAAADGDGADDDGVTLGTIQVGALGATLTVNVQNAPSGAKLDAWIDFNGDGTWGGPGEEIASNVAVVNGDNTITFDVPSDAISGITYARFRLSTAGNLGPAGPAVDGEVEDYAVTITPPNGGGAFGGQTTVATSESWFASMSAADVDGDGDLDLLTSSFNDRGVSWYENDGHDHFTVHTFFNGINEDLASTVIGTDLDGDGDLDVVALSTDNDKVAWYENDGQQNFVQHIISLDTEGAQDVKAADVDNDGDIDLVVAAYLDNSVNLYVNDGHQNFALQILEYVGSPTSVDVADVDGDGDLDVLSTSAYSDKVTWYQNDGNLNFTIHAISTTADGAYSAVAVDLDHDGDMDVVAASYLDNTVAWYENDGAENFLLHTISTNHTRAHELDIADLDGDGDLDILAPRNADDDHRLGWFENDGNQNFIFRSIATFNETVPRDNVIADIDGDGDLDIISSLYMADLVTFENRNAVNLSVSATAGSEVGTTVITVTATTSFPVDSNATVTLAVSGTNITTGDYGLSSTVITILSGQTSGSVTFTIKNDALVEGTETAILTLVNPSTAIELGNTISQQITIADDDAPTITSGATANVVEGVSVSTVVLDVNTLPTSAIGPTLTYSLSGPDAALFNIDPATGQITFVTSPVFAAPADQDENNVYEITVTVTANVDPAASATQDLQITVVPQTPPAIVIPEPTAQYPLGRSPAFISSTAMFTYSSPVTPEFDGAKLTVSIVAGRNKKDRLSIVAKGDRPGQINVKGHKVLLGGEQIGTVTGGKGRHGDLVVTFNNHATTAGVQSLLRRLNFETQKEPGTTRTIAVQITNINGVDSNVATRDFAVIPA